MRFRRVIPRHPFHPYIFISSRLQNSKTCSYSHWNTCFNLKDDLKLSPSTLSFSQSRVDLSYLPCRRTISDLIFAANSTPLRGFQSLLMPSAADHQRRSDLWSYVNFSPSPRRRSASLPTKSPFNDPHEKPGRHSAQISAGSSKEILGNVKKAWISYMPQIQRGRLVKVGGVLAFLFFLFFLLSPGERERVGRLVGSEYA